MRSRALVAAACAAGLVLAACGNGEPARPAPTPPALGWQEATVPVPPGGPGRVVVRSATRCDGTWYLGGGVAMPDGNTRPAVWTSTDARTFTPLPISAFSYYGKLNIVYTLACAGRELAAVGARSGGVHGNPRVSSWRLMPDGVLTEQVAAFELYGGPNAVNVVRMTRGPQGYMITGNRVSGPAVWTSPDGAAFQIHEAVQPLANDPSVDSAASDVLAVPGGWVVVGGGTPAGRVDRDPIVWTSADGVGWKRTVLAGTGDYEEMQRVVAVGGELLAVGLRGGTFGVWHSTDGTGWDDRASFGDTRPPAAGGGGAQRVAGVLSAAVNGNTVLVTVSDGQAYQLWASTDQGRTWTGAALPAPNAAGADRAAAVVAGGERWLYLADDEQAGRVWTADTSR